MIRNVAQLGKRVWLAGIRGHLNTRCRPPDSERTRYRPHLEEFESRTTPASLITDFTQGANGDVVHSPPLGDITWLNGILNPNNSEYFEGVSTLQRLFFDNIATTSGDVHTLTFSHQAVKGSTHAYDFLTSWAQALAATNAIAPGTLVNPNTDSSDAGSIIEAVEPGSSSPANFTTVTTALRGGSFFFDVDIPDNLGSILGDNVQDRIAAYEGFFGNRTLRIWGNAAITSASLVFTGYTGSSGNEQANYTLTWTSASSRILVEFAGHLAMGRDFTISGVGYGVGKGAGSISGGPYHISLDKLDGASLGKQDNQIQANAVGLPPDYTIVKTGDELSKIGDLTSYTITITNTGGLALFPQSINDTLAGSLSAGSFSESGTDNDILDLGETWTRTYDAQIPQGASDPFVNTVTAIFDTQANLSGIEVTRNDEHSVNLFQPAIDVLKEVVSAPATIVAGSVVRFRITITDGDTSWDSPDLVPFSIVDDKFGTIAASQFTESGGVGGLDDNKLQENEVWTYEYDYTVLVSDFPSLTNEVRVLFKPEGFPNELRDTSRVGLAVELPVEEGRMTGGGSVFLQSGDTGGPVGTRVTHGFQIHCSPLATNNRLEINWGKPNNHFHLGNLIPASIVCRDTGIVQAPPDAPIDTFEADGVGRFSGTVGDIKYHNVYAEIHFLFTDGGPEKGEPGLYDTAQYRIMIDTDGDGAVDTLALDNFGGDPTADRLDRGNHQAHDEIKRFTSAITQFLSQIEQKLDQLDNPNLSSSQVRRYTDDLLDLFAQFDAEVATTTIATTTATTTSTSSTSTSLGDIWFPPDDDDLVLNGVLVG